MIRDISAASLYGTTAYGGDPATGAGVVYKLDAEPAMRRCCILLHGRINGG